MQDVGAVIGGEGNGGVIDPRVGFVRDPFIGLALVLNLMNETGRKLSELVAELPRYTIVKDRFTAEPSSLPGIYDRMQAQWSDAKFNRTDGLRLDWRDRWVHVRPSNTEPIVRVIAEAPEPEAAHKLCREVGTLLSQAQDQRPKTTSPPPKLKRKPPKPANAKSAVRKRKSKRG
jgi:phosphomannomutase